MAAIKYKVELPLRPNAPVSMRCPSLPASQCARRVQALATSPDFNLKLRCRCLGVKADQGLRPTGEIADVLGQPRHGRQSAEAVFTWRKDSAAILTDRGRAGSDKLDGRQEAHLIAFASSAAPEGHTHWTLQLLADKVVRWYAESISLETVRQGSTRLANSSPFRRKSGLIPKVSRGVRILARMEDVLDLYHQERRQSGASSSVFRRDLPAIDWGGASAHRGCPRTGGTLAHRLRAALYYLPYQRNGTRHLFMICEPKGGWRHVQTERRTAVDFAPR